MFHWLFILVLTLTTSVAIPKYSRAQELQRLVRLPQTPMPPALEFHRNAGFQVYPDARTAQADARRLLGEATGTPEDGFRSLQAARILDAAGDLNGMIRQQAWAIRNLRRQIQLEPSDARARLALAEALAGFGRFEEGEMHLAEAGKHQQPKGEEAYWLATARFYKEWAWQAFAGHRYLFDERSFLEIVHLLAATPPDAMALEKCREKLRMANAALERAEKFHGGGAELPRERAIFLSFRGVVEEAIRRMQSRDESAVPLGRFLFVPRALDDLLGSVDKDAERAAAAAFAIAYSEPGNYESPKTLALSSGGFAKIREQIRILEELAESSGREAATALEMLGCIQLDLLEDYRGAERSFEQALARDAERHRSWDLLVQANALQEDPASMINACLERRSSLPGPRSSALLIQAYYRGEHITQAEWTAVASIADHPDDFVLNLSLAALLLRRENAADYLWRVQQAIAQAEKKLQSSATVGQKLDLLLVKSIYLGLSDQPDRALEMLREYSRSNPPSPELREVIRVLQN